MQLHMDDNSNKATPAAIKVADVLNDEGFLLTKSGGYATDGTVKEWRKVLRKEMDNSPNGWEAKLYQSLTCPTAVEGVMGLSTLRRKNLIEVVEQSLRKAVAEAK